MQPNNTYTVVRNFEDELAIYTKAPYVICTDCCTNALLLCFLYSDVKTVTLPKNTYVGVAQAALLAGKKVLFHDITWRGVYQIYPTNIFDAAKRFTHGMYMPGSNMCLSFHYKKHLKIGRGGAILTDDKDFYEWAQRARNSGRDNETPLPEHTYYVKGINAVLHPELARIGVKLLSIIDQDNDDLPEEDYGDLSIQMKNLID